MTLSNPPICVNMSLWQPQREISLTRSDGWDKGLPMIIVSTDRYHILRRRRTNYFASILRPFLWQRGLPPYAGSGGSRNRRSNSRQGQQASAGPTPKVLVERAKAEGEVAFYSSLQAQQIDPFIRVFQKRYPFIKVNPYRVSGNRQVIKIQTELNAGNHLFDVTNGSSEQADRDQEDWRPRSLSFAAARFL